MPLTVAFVSSLRDILPPAVAFLSRDHDPFARPRIVVPNAGTKAWLHDRLARRLGTSGSGRDDGIVANVEILYPGAIGALVQPPPDPRKPDPWSFDRLTFAVLDVITAPEAGELGLPFHVAGEPLLIARRIAGLFDEYHVRRPGMILEWERGKGNAVLAPTANDVQHDGHPVPASLRDSDRWQFRVWRTVRQRIDAPSPPARRSVDHRSGRERLLVAGLESLSLPQLECLERLGGVCEVEAILVHPSPGLRRVWGESGQQPLREDLRDRPLQKRRDPEFPAGVDPLLPVWLSGARDLQDLLAARAVPVAELPHDRGPPRDSLLARMQRTVSAGGRPEAVPHDPATDRSLVIHRCHSLSRQAEVLHDALLQAFAEIEDLEPHQVAIVSPCLDRAAAHLEAVFQRTVVGTDVWGTEREIVLPLVVADRGIRETSEAADLLAALLALPGSRAAVDDVLAVAGHPLVRAAFGIDDDTVATWTDFVDRTRVRWGFDAAHRARHGLELTGDAEIHTWKFGLERMLLGGLLPDAPARPELGGVVPLADLDPVDLAAIATLVRILDVIRTLATAAATPRPVAEWCDTIEQAVVGLAGEECPQLAEPLVHLRRLRAAAAGTAAAGLAVPFADVRGLLVTWLEETTGRQPLRTGRITATSMVPLRGVPFRVVCVIGYDDGAVGGGEADGDDLVSRQQLVGDVDPRADERRALLDCLLAAEERLVITCNGRSVKSNKRVPLVTPLAELVDFAVRHGVAREAFDAASGIEIDHPRHHLSRRNFEQGGVVAAGVWSHDRIAADVIEAVESQPADGGCVGARPRGTAAARGSTTDGPMTSSPPSGRQTVELALLEKLVQDPLRLFLEKTLGIDTWRNDDEPIPATIPLTLAAREIRELALERVRLLMTDPTAAAAWVESLRRSGRLPYGGLGGRQLAEIIELADGIVQRGRDEGIPLVGTRTLVEPLDLGDFLVVGEVPGVHEDDAEGQVVVWRTGVAKKDGYDRPFHVAALHVLAARARGARVRKASVLARHRSWAPGALSDAGRPVPPAQLSTILIDPAVDPRDRLRELCGLAVAALAAPCGLFGLRDSAVDRRTDDFEAYVTGTHWGGGPGGYGRTTEAIVYGMAPVFTEIFAPGSRELTFLDRFSRCLQLQNRRGSSEYTLQ